MREWIRQQESANGNEDKTDEVNFNIYLCEAQILNLQYLLKVSTKVERNRGNNNLTGSIHL